MNILSVGHLVTRCSFHIVHANKYSKNIKMLFLTLVVYMIVSKVSFVDYIMDFLFSPRNV